MIGAIRLQKLRGTLFKNCSQIRSIYRVDYLPVVIARSHPTFSSCLSFIPKYLSQFFYLRMSIISHSTQPRVAISLVCAFHPIPRAFDHAAIWQTPTGQPLSS